MRLIREHLAAADAEVPEAETIDKGVKDLVQWRNCAIKSLGSLLATTDWRACVLIEEKHNVYQSASGQRLQKLIISDDEGEKVMGIIWNKQIEALDHVLQPFKTYKIGGVAVTDIAPAFHSSSFGLTVQWTIDSRAYILPISEKTEEIPYPLLKTTPFSQLPSCIHSQKEIDLLAVVVEIKSRRPVNTVKGPTEVQDLTVLTQEMQPILLSLWSDFVINQGTKVCALKNSLPVILCKRLRVTTHEVLSLSTHSYFYVEVEPDIPSARELQNWAQNHANEIQHAVLLKNNEEIDPALTYNLNQELIPVAHIAPNSKSSWVNTKVLFAHLPQDFFFIACPQCFGLTTASNGEKFLCNACKVFQVASPRCKLVADLQDESGSIKATFYDKNSEKVFGFPTVEIASMNSKQLRSMLMKAQSSFEEEKITIEIKPSKRRYTDGLTRYSVQKWFRTNPTLTIEYKNVESHVAEEKDLMLPEGSSSTMQKANLNESASTSLKSDETSNAVRDTNAAQQMEIQKEKNINSKDFGSERSMKKSKNKIN